MRLTSVATPEHIEEAFRLFNVSTVDVARSGINEHLNLSPEIANEIKVTNSGAGLRMKQIPRKKQVHIIGMKGEEDKLNQINSELETSIGRFGSTIQMSQQSCNTLSDGCCTSISNATGDFIPIAQVFHEAIYYLQWFTVTINGNFEAMYVLVSMGMASDQKVKPPRSMATGHLVEARQLLSPPQRMLCGNMHGCIA